jgi:hypothetical protein
MNWIVENRWLTAAVPLFAPGVTALAGSAGAERRQKVAHGASRGAAGVIEISSPGGA